MLSIIHASLAAAIFYPITAAPNQQNPASGSPLAAKCGRSTTSNIVCINHFASVMPYHFFRAPTNDSYDSMISSIEVPDKSWSLVGKADFLVFDENRGLEILGDSPEIDYPFKGQLDEDISFGALVWSPVTNKLYLSLLGAGRTAPGLVQQQAIDLSANPPLLGNMTTTPSVFNVVGGTIHNGLIYWAVGGSNRSIDGIEQRAGIYTFDPLTNKTNNLLNNYFGYYFDGPDDLFVDDVGDVWFTDAEYAWFNDYTDTAPVLGPALYRFSPSTGAVSIVEDTFVQPNGIALAPVSHDSARKVYVSDTGASTGSISPSVGPNGTSINLTGKHTLYAFDLSSNGKHITNKHPIYLAQDAAPDGVQVAANGYIVATSAAGVDVLDEDGELLVRMQLDFYVNCFAWVGKDRKELWLVGDGAIARVKWNLVGQPLK